MSSRTKAAIAVAAIALSAVGIFFVHQLRKPFLQQLSTARYVELIRKGSIWDGGSRYFVLRLPYWHTAVVFVPHRNPGLGGNPGFQEVWIRPDEYSRDGFQLEAGSELEAHVVSLLRTAAVAAPRPGSPEDRVWEPTPDDLKWLVERIQNRRSKW